MLYLAKESGQLVPGDDKGESRVTQWLMFQMGGIGPMMGQSNVFYRYFPEKIPAAIDRYHKECRRLYEVLERQLEERDYLCDEFSLADFANWCWVRIYFWGGSSIDADATCSSRGNDSNATVAAPRYRPIFCFAASAKETAICGFWW